MSHTDHHHHHSSSNKKRLLTTILLNILITVSQIIGGVITGSLALISDALHNFSDVIALLISYIATKLIEKEPTEKRTFGYKRAEVFAGFINSISLIAVAIFLIKSAIGSFKAGAEIEHTSYIIYLAILSIVLNAVSAYILRDRGESNMNVRSAYLHLFSDMLTSIAVLIGGILMTIWGIRWVDPIISIGIAIYLIISSWEILTKSSAILMQFTPKEVNIVKVLEIINSFDLIANIHHTHIWQLSEDEIFLEAHIEFSKDLKLSEVRDITSKLREKVTSNTRITHVTLQSEFGDVDKKELIATHI